jgi:hypothetical protein
LIIVPCGNQPDRDVRASPPTDPGLIPLTVREVKRLLAAALSRPLCSVNADRWLE